MSKTKAALSHASSPLALATCMLAAVVLTALLVPAARRCGGSVGMCILPPVLNGMVPMLAPSDYVADFSVCFVSTDAGGQL